MRTIRYDRTSWFAVLCLAALLVISPARATSFSTDNSDIWSTVGEDGWGLQMVQRADVIFVTMYVYDGQTDPIWYTATLTNVGADPDGLPIWSGDLYMTNGPWFGLGAFRPSEVVYQKVGQFAYVAQSLVSGSLTYSVSGGLVTKQIRRFTLKNEDYSGTYVGTYKLAATNCIDPTNNGSQLLSVTLNVTQSANSLKLRAMSAQGFACSYSGDFQQFGQFGQSRGTFSCINTQTGVHTIFAMTVTPDDIRGRIAGSDSLGCSLSGNFTALRP
jgi:hypothetical protein